MSFHRRDAELNGRTADTDDGLLEDRKTTCSLLATFDRAAMFGEADCTVQLVASSRALPPVHPALLAEIHLICANPVS